jgi:hypothetical protein
LFSGSRDILQNHPAQKDCCIAQTHPQINRPPWVKKPKYVYVNTVYREGDFSGLGIGTS